MGHELYIVNGVAQVAYDTNAPPPWWLDILDEATCRPLVGIPVDGGIDSVPSAFRNLPFGTVHKRPMLVEVADGMRAVEGHYVNVRAVDARITDAGVSAAHEVLIGPVGSKFTNLQDSEFCELALQGGVNLSTIGLLGDAGQRKFATFSLDPITIDPNGIADHLTRWVNLFDASDGSRATQATDSTIRTVCANTEAIAIQGASIGSKLRHTKSLHDKVQALGDAIAEAAGMQDRIADAIYRMLSVPGNAALDAVLDHVAPIDKDASAKMQTRRSNMRDAIVEKAKGDLSEALVGWNGWAVYNGFTEWADHARTVRGTEGAATIARLGQAFDPESPITATKREVSSKILALV